MECERYVAWWFVDCVDETECMPATCECLYNLSNGRSKSRGSHSGVGEVLQRGSPVLSYLTRARVTPRGVHFRPPQASRQGWPYYIRGGRAACGAASIVGPPLAAGLPGVGTGLSERLWGHPWRLACPALARAYVNASGATPGGWGSISLSVEIPLSHAHCLGISTTFAILPAAAFARA